MLYFESLRSIIIDFIFLSRQQFLFIILLKNTNEFTVDCIQLFWKEFMFHQLI